jgi:hypothetical protein
MAENSRKWLVTIGWLNSLVASKPVMIIADAGPLFAYLWLAPLR